MNARSAKGPTEVVDSHGKVQSAADRDNVMLLLLYVGVVPQHDRNALLHAHQAPSSGRTYHIATFLFHRRNCSLVDFTPM